MTSSDFGYRALDKEENRRRRQAEDISRVVQVNDVPPLEGEPWWRNSPPQPLSETERASIPVDAMASITGKYSGLAPAITAFIAAVFTV